MRTVRRSKKVTARRGRIQELLDSFEIEDLEIEELSGLRNFFGQILGTFLESGLNTKVRNIGRLS